MRLELAQPGRGRAAGRRHRGAQAPRVRRRPARAASPSRAASGSTSSVATSRVSPTSTPASIIASATRKKYAGPEPDKPVTASSAGSPTRTTIPTAPSRRSARSRCSAPACVPPAIADAPMPDERGRVGHRADDRAFGHQCLDRRDRHSRPRSRARACRRRARATRSRGSRRHRRASPRARRRRRRRPPRPRSARPGSSRRAVRVRRGAHRRSPRSTSASASHPPSRRPPTSAAPIFPPPSNATRDIAAEGNRHRRDDNPSDGANRAVRTRSRTSSGPRNLRVELRTSPNGADPPAPRARRRNAP